jgi:hypothetical protein
MMAGRGWPVWNERRDEEWMDGWMDGWQRMKDPGGGGGWNPGGGEGSTSEGS